MIRAEKVHSDDLLACFFTECEAQFRFLERTHGFGRIAGLAEYKKGRLIITPHSSSTPGIGPFHLITRYERGPLAFEIGYSDENYLLDCHVYHNLSTRLSLEDVLKAAKRPSAAKILSRPASRPELLLSQIRELAAIVHKNNSWLGEESTKLFERAITIRETILEHNIREQYKREMEALSSQAAKAFLQKDFQKVVTLLTPYESHLSGADLKKLNQARRRLQL